MSADFPLPPVTRTADGTPRRLGVEIEFAGLDVERAAREVAAELGGRCEALSPYEQRVIGTELGDFAVELDYAWLKAQGRELGPITGDEGPFERLPERTLAEVARHIVPVEVVSPPFAMDRLPRLQPLIARLRAAGAEGTRGSPLYAFGLHFNPELPRLAAATITAYLRAFLCLYDWLVHVSGVDWTRRLTPFVDAFPADYAARVVDPDYAPDLTTLIDDYLARNADRNRALDMLPLFAHLDEPRVRAAVDDPRIKPRPTLHYRLANSDVDRPDWSLASSWSHWVQVETLACDPGPLADMAARYSEHLARPSPDDPGGWARVCERWLSAGGR